MIKADAGTYGKGVMTVHDASEVAALTKRERTKMNDAKEGLQVHDVIVQEGVHTFERVENAVAEPVVYMIDRYVVEGFRFGAPGKAKREELDTRRVELVDGGRLAAEA